MNNWHCGMNFCHLASPSSEQLGWPSILGWSEVIRLKFGDLLEHAEGYSTLFFFEPIGLGLHEEKSQWNIFGLGRFWDAISVSGDVRTGRTDPRSRRIL